MFCHEKLSVYRKSVEFAGGVLKIIQSLPPGNSDITGQLRRSAMSITLNIAEGAGRTGKADKQRFYSIARGSALECASIFDIITAWGIESPRAMQELRALLEEIVAMVSALALKNRALR